eukprot:6782828-Pyramimonas_sp.AAC.1
MLQSNSSTQHSATTTIRKMSWEWAHARNYNKVGKTLTIQSLNGVLIPPKTIAAPRWVKSHLGARSALIPYKPEQL